jgi:hypothetical protein
VTGSAGGASWALPAGWKQEPEKPMRVASFFAGDAEVIIAQFEKGNFGDMLSNINRWRGMAGLDRLTEAGQAGATPVSVGGATGDLYDFANPKATGAVQHVKVAVIPSGNLVWFIRFQGSMAAVESQQQAFDQFLKSMTFGGSK